MHPSVKLTQKNKKGAGMKEEQVCSSIWLNRTDYFLFGRDLQWSSGPTARTLQDSANLKQVIKGIVQINAPEALTGLG